MGIIMFCSGCVSHSTTSTASWQEELNEEHIECSDNNSIVFFKNGKEKFDDLLPAVRQAKSSIHMEDFYLMLSETTPTTNLSKKRN